MQEVRLKGIIVRNVDKKSMVDVRIEGMEADKAVRIKTDKILRKKMFGWR